MSDTATLPAAAAPKGGNRGPLIIIMAMGIAVFGLLAAGEDPWSILFVNPLINALVLLDKVVFGNFFLAIVLFTVLLRLVTIPFTIRQLESTRAMQAVQPQMQDIQKKYKDPKRRQEEMVKLYREYKINPLGCFVPVVIQFAVFIGLNTALRHLVGGSPESLVSLSGRLYPFEFIQTSLPLNQHFLWMNLGEPDSTFVLPLLVGVSTYVQQKMAQTPAANPQMQQQQQMMMWMMPIFLIFITLSLPSGVSVYWVVSNIFSLVASYYVYGKKALSWRQFLPNSTPGEAPGPAVRKADIEAESDDAIENAEPAPEAPQRRERRTHGKRRGRRKNR